jgi:hypothetical protein
MSPTTQDLQRLVENARREHGAIESSAATAEATWDRVTVAWSRFVNTPKGTTQEAWTTLRSVCLMLALYALRAAWEAGRRMAPQCGRPGPEGASCYKPAGHESAHAGDGWHWDYMNPATRAPDTSPAAHDDVEALLRESDRRWEGSRDARATPPDEVSLYGDLRIHHGLAAALRTQREREQRLRVEAQAQGIAAAAARARLLDVVDHVWPDGTRGPACVREASAFLAGEVQPPKHDDAREIELLRLDLATKCDELERMGGRWAAVQKELEREQRAHADTAQLWLRRRDELEAERDAAKEEARKALAAQNQAEAELASTKARLRTLEGGLEKLMRQMSPKGTG